MSSVIMAGALNNFDVPSILQAVSLSRQCTLLRLWDRNKHETGEIRLKAGQLLDAACGPKRGRSALHALLRRNHHSFRVERFADPVNLPDPIGPLAALLLEMPRPVAKAPPAPPPVRVAPAADPVPAAIGTLSATATRELSELAALSQLLLCDVSHSDRCWAWNRHALLLQDEVLRDLVRSLLPVLDKLPHWTTLERGDATLVVRPTTTDAVGIYAFPPSTPLGLVRMVVGAAQRIVETHARDTEAL